jgi:hypothetical protein
VVDIVIDASIDGSFKGKKWGRPRDAMRKETDGPKRKERGEGGE